jgi:hypothetical protein
VSDWIKQVSTAQTPKKSKCFVKAPRKFPNRQFKPKTFDPEISNKFFPLKILHNLLIKTLIVMEMSLLSDDRVMRIQHEYRVHDNEISRNLDNRMYSLSFSRFVIFFGGKWKKFFPLKLFN